MSDKRVKKTERLKETFFARSCLDAAPDLVGKLLCRKLPDGTVLRLRVTETEAYNGVDDTACHACKGKTPRAEMLWHGPGTIYIYLCYGMHWMLNVVTGNEGDPQCVLIRACKNYKGPGRLTKYLRLDRSLNGKNIVSSDELWFEDDGFCSTIGTDRRVGIEYAAPADRERRWRFIECSSEQEQEDHQRNSSK